MKTLLFDTLRSFAMNSIPNQRKLERILAESNSNRFSIPKGRFEAQGTYRTRNGKGLFTFDFVKDQGLPYEIDILSMPSYGGRNQSVVLTHRLPSSRPGVDMMICIADEHKHKLNTLEAAQDIAIAWSELTMTYIEQGITIDAQIAARQT